MASNFNTKKVSPIKSAHSLLWAFTPTLVFTLLISCSHPQSKEDKATHSEASASSLLTNIHQMTFGGLRAGEGYFSPDGQLMIFQSERESNNPFYQMYVKNLATGTTKRVSPGVGKTTCGWIFPDKKHVIFSSTHMDKSASKKQTDEIEFRNSGKQKRYSWDYDENYDIFKASIDGKNYVNLTRTKGYDAESSVSPDGKWIVFASNRSAYNSELSESDASKLATDPSYFMDLYIMKSDGSQVKQLTNVPGYDGGPFFSPDGERIVWRRFSPDGHTAEVHTMKIDGSDVKQITRLKSMSWAPFYHPSGDYIVFTTNIHGYSNFELYIVDQHGQHEPVRVTYLDGFDGLPVFTPDGKNLTWNRKISATESQIMMAEWNDEAARRLLGLPPAPPTIKNLSPNISQSDLKTIIKFLASSEMGGRDTGSVGEQIYTKSIGQIYKELGLATINGITGDDYIQKFEFNKEAQLGSQNKLTLIDGGQKDLLIQKDWRPLSFSKTGEVAATSVVFVGYGIRAPGDDKNAPYDSFANLDVKDKWVLVFRYIPENISAERRIYLQRYSRLQFKALAARDLGARGIIFVSGPNSNAKDSLIGFSSTSGSDMGIPAISISDEVARSLFEANHADLKTVQSQLDKGDTPSVTELSQTKFSAQIDIRTQKDTGRNVLALLSVPNAKRTLIIGAHGDHLGTAHVESSLKTSNDKDPIHHGADDNASGVSAVMELAHFFTHFAKTNPGAMKQNIVFAVWSGEELGNLGSSAFTRKLKRSKLDVSAYINMDMIGRWKVSPETNQLEPLLIQGIGSSDNWREIIEQAKIEFPVKLQSDPYLPTDSTAFYLAKIPVINFFTGVHKEYHTPRDTEEKINYAGLENVTSIISKIAQVVTAGDLAPKYVEAPANAIDLKRSFRIYLGTIPDYSATESKGVKLSGVIAGGPAERAGLRSGDIIVELSNRKIENIHDYVYSLETIKPEVPTQIIIVRNGKRESISITPKAKE